ncbi:MAG: hypothetical protein AB7O88_15470 [Reyranellaceae bacterium]
MKVSWTERNRTRAVDRLEGVVALPPDAASAPEAAVAKADIASPDAAALQSAGWEFVHADPAVTMNCRAVYQESGGRLLIDGRGMTVRFRPNASETQIHETLSAHGLAMTRKLGFAPNLFEVSLADPDAPGSDIVKLANEVGNEPAVDYASPSFIQAISGRTRAS